MPVFIRGSALKGRPINGVYLLSFILITGHNRSWVLRGRLDPGPIPAHPNSRQIGSEGFAVGGCAEGCESPPGGGVDEGEEVAVPARAVGAAGKESEWRSDPPEKIVSVAVLQDGPDGAARPCERERSPGSKALLQVSTRAGAAHAPTEA